MEFVTKEKTEINQESGEIIHHHSIDGIRITSCCGCVMATIIICAVLRLVFVFL